MRLFPLGLLLATLVGTASVSFSQSYYGEAPSRWNLDYFDATQIDSSAKAFQLADYDRTGRRVLFYPWGGIVTRPYSTVLAYHVDKDFTSPESYEAVDLSDLVSPDAQGFGTGFIDRNADWSYFVPFRKRHGLLGQEANDLAIRFNLHKELGDKSAYETFRLSTMENPPPKLGWITGVEAKGHAYFLPYGTPVTGEPWHELHGVLLRYNVAMAFNNPQAWSWVDLSHMDRRAVGFQSIATKGDSLYLIPYYSGKDLMVRYDLTKPFNQAGSYEAVQLTKLNPRATGYTGAVVAGDYLVLVPWRNINEANQRDPEQSAHVAAAYDMRKRLSDPSAWSFIDLLSVNPMARGYQFGWYDKLGYVHFVPAHDFSTKLPPPFIAWNTRKPFTDPAAWITRPRDQNPASTGAAYDGEYAWFAPYGKAGNSGTITRVQFK